MGKLINEMSSIKDKVEQILKKVPPTRDSDAILIAFYWRQELGTEKVSTMSADDFLNHYATGKMAKAEAIRRTRQLIQQENESLRGKTYKGRKIDGIEARNEIFEV